MNTEMRKLATIASFVAVTASGFLNTARAQTPGGPVLLVEKSAINRDLADIREDRARIKYLQNDINTHRMAGINTNADRKELCKAKADYQRSEAYLRADKHDLIEDHLTYIRERRAILTGDHVDIIKLNFGLQSDLRKASATAMNRTQEILNKKQQLKADRHELTQARIDRNNDVLAVNKKIEESKAQNVALLYMQNGLAQAENLAMK